MLIKLLNNVEKTLIEIQNVLRGEKVITAVHSNAINAIYDVKVPKYWMVNISGGEEISWISPTLGLWFTGLIDRSN